MQAVGILGGMGPAAGADFVRLFVQGCTRHLQGLGLPVHDQAYPEHWLVQLPMPDRTQALRSDPQSPAGPAAHLLQGAGRLAALGVRSVALACNTAHAWHGQIQALFPQLRVLHIAQQTALYLKAGGARQALVLGQRLADGGRVGHGGAAGGGGVGGVGSAHAPQCRPGARARPPEAKGGKPGAKLRRLSSALVLPAGGPCGRPPGAFPGA